MNNQGIFGLAFAYLLGANWKTSLSGFVAILSAIIHGKPETIQWIPEPFRTFVWSASEYVFFAGAATFVANVKDKRVTGGTVQQTSTGAASAEPSTSVTDTKAAEPKP